MVTASASVTARPSKWRYALVVLLGFAGLLTLVANEFLVSAAQEATADSFPRSPVPGSITADLHPGTWYLWLEGPARIDEVTATDRSGRSLEVETVEDGTAYTHDGLLSEPVARFEVPRGGMMEDVTVRIAGVPDFSDVRFALGPPDDFSYVSIARALTITSIVIIVAVILTIIIAPVLVRRRRDRSATAPSNSE